jgi:hypothetical protein
MPKQIDEKIHGETRDYILNVKEDDYLEHLQSEFALDPLTLDQDHIEVSMQFEKEVEMMDFGERIFVKRSFLTFCVPFSGRGSYSSIDRHPTR